jgi:hypothetical protein
MGYLTRENSGGSGLDVMARCHRTTLYEPCSETLFVLAGRMR